MKTEKNVFQILARTEIGKLPAWVQHPHFSHKVALFAHAIASPGRKAFRIHDRFFSRMSQMRGRIAMAPFAGDGFVFGLDGLKAV